MLRDRKKVQRLFSILAALMVLAMIAMAIGPSFLGF